MATNHRVTKDAKFTMVMTIEERKKLDEIAKKKLVSAANVVRMFIHHEYERLFEEAPPHRRKVSGNARSRPRSNP